MNSIVVTRNLFYQPDHTWIVNLVHELLVDLTQWGVVGVDVNVGCSHEPVAGIGEGVDDGRHLQLEDAVVLLGWCQAGGATCDHVEPRVPEK